MPRIAAVLGAAALALCYPKPGLCFLGWFALAPLLREWDRARPRDCFWLGLSAGFAFHAVLFFWVYSTCRFAGVAVPAALAAWAALSLLLGLNWGAIGALGSWLSPLAAPALRPWLWAAAWTAVAAAAERWTPRLAGDLLSYTQWRHLSLIQIGALAGPHALGFLIVAVNAQLALLWGPDRRRRLSGCALAAGIVLMVWGYGVFRLGQRRDRSQEPPLTVEILQPAVDQYRKWDARFVSEIRENLDGLLGQARVGLPHLVVWPESSWPEVVHGEEGLEEARSWSRRLASFQLVGAVVEQGGALYSAAVLLGPGGERRGLYRKRQLVPFGEFIPAGFNWLRGYVGILNVLGGASPGDARQPLLGTPFGPTGVTICYEAAFPRWARLDAARGARVLVNITNDGWYKDTAGPTQHFHTNVFRAVETGLPVIRAGNNGVSAVIDPWGAVLSRLDLNERGRLSAPVPLQSSWPEAGTPYVRFGDWFGLSCLGLAGALALRRARR